MIFTKNVRGFVFVVLDLMHAVTDMKFMLFILLFMACSLYIALIVRDYL